MSILKRSIVVIAVCISNFVISQTEYKQINYREIIQSGIKLHDEKKYDEAIAEFKKIQRNDSGFALASVELINTYIANNKDSSAVVLCDELLKHSDQYTPNAILFKANALDNLKQIKESEEIYRYGAKKYPANNSFLYELGVSKFRQEKYFEAYELFKQSIQINPMHAASHLQMGSLALKQGKVVPAMLALQYFLVCENRSARAQNIVNSLESIARMELGDDKLIEIAEIKSENDFTDLESIVRSKIALSAKYKAKTDLTYDVAKQIQLVCENIGKYKDVTGFYNSFYGKFFDEVWNRKFFEPYLYNAFAGIKNDEISKWNTKNQKELDEYRNWGYDYMCLNFASYNENFQGTNKVVPHWYSRNKLFGAGEKNKLGNNEGYWNYYFDNGIKKSEGAFVDGKKDGPWIYYFENSNIESQVTYNKGKEVHYKEFFENTNPRANYPINNNLIDGKVVIYYSNGKPLSEYDYVAGKIAGTENKFYKNGSKQYSITNNDKKLEGDLIEYYDNGKIKQKCKFVNGKRIGVSSMYHNNTKNSIKNEGVYVDGEPDGIWKIYHQNGALSEEGLYKEGKIDGLWKTYNDNGILVEEENFSSGKFDGISKYFTKDGKLWEELTYKKGKIQEIKSYKETGELLGSHKLSGKSNILNLYYPNGVKRKEGLYKNGEMDRLWKSYNSFGVLTTEENYNEGVLDGSYKTYFTNGKVKTETFYKNGEENSYFKMYFINGQLKREGYVVNGNVEGTWKYYYIDGTLQYIKYFNEGEEEGWTEAYDVKGKISTEDYYKLTCLTKVIYHDTSGKIKQNVDLPGGNGTIDEKHYNGKPLFHKEFEFDFPKGKSYVYYPDGTVSFVKEYENGKQVGVQKRYDVFGKIFLETPYFNDMENGRKLKYHYNGKLASEYDIVDNETNGTGKIYYENGKVLRTISYKMGVADGDSRVYDELGELIYVRRYDDDLLTGYTYNNAKGELESFKKIEVGDFKVACNYANGKKSIVANYTNGDLNGSRTTYCSNGNVAETEVYYYDLQHGETKSYYPNGTPKTIENYYYGEEHGNFKFFYENGKLRKEENYLYGTQHGVAKYYSETGALLKTVNFYDGIAISSN